MFEHLFWIGHKLTCEDEVGLVLNDPDDCWLVTDKVRKGFNQSSDLFRPGHKALNFSTAVYHKYLFYTVEFCRIAFATSLPKLCAKLQWIWKLLHALAGSSMLQGGRMTGDNDPNSPSASALSQQSPSMASSTTSYDYSSHHLVAQPTGLQVCSLVHEVLVWCWQIK